MGGHRWPDILIPRPRLAYSLYNFHGATMVFYRRASPLVRLFSRFLAQNLTGLRDLWIGGHRWPHIWIPLPRLTYSLYNFHWATMTIKGSLQRSIAIVKAFLTRKSRRKLAKNLRFFWRKCDLNVKFCFGIPNWHILARNHVIWLIDRENRCRGLGCRLKEEPKNSRVTWCAFSHIWGGGERG